MVEQPRAPVSSEEQKPGYGVDRTQIRQLLPLTPQERLRIAVESARNLAEMLEKMRRVQ
jgi:hypothetical protein